jgi:hypothetical protein
MDTVPVLALIRPTTGICLAAAMLLILMLLGISVVAILLHPSPAQPGPDLGDKHNPPRWVCDGAVWTAKPVPPPVIFTFTMGGTYHGTII